MIDEDLQHIRGELDWLRAKYDTGAVPGGIYAVIKGLEEDIGWSEFRRREKTLTRSIQDAYSIT